MTDEGIHWVQPSFSTNGSLPYEDTMTLDVYRIAAVVKVAACGAFALTGYGF